ncbi:MAG: phosphatidylserine decarboxylase family protein [Flavobacteriales bacterium]|nr:phosphatidylserine decarboxylase family protein [Flavobacteriales bacterium]MDG1780006.1 phosphatidylserine decarboxylase family protein [Flavobacteriales bacterium]MDG2247454.1 phosphatidylserine decarboxylase family protein [Flavobacteriales bacterium]
MYLHREGRVILISLALVLIAILSALYAWLGTGAVFYISLVLALGVFILFAQFFRIPKREVAQNENHVICPSDGKVVVIEEVEETEYFKDKRIQISVFMSPLNVHAQWCPIEGEVKLAKYHPGLFLVAWHPKSSTDNERTSLVIKGKKHEVLFRQIAGAVARRIRFYIKPGQQVSQGEECGFIKFGSRVDIFLPLGTDVKVNIGDKVQGKTTVLAELK